MRKPRRQWGDEGALTCSVWIQEVGSAKSTKASAFLSVRCTSPIRRARLLVLYAGGGRKSCVQAGLRCGRRDVRERDENVEVEVEVEKEVFGPRSRRRLLFAHVYYT